MHRPFVLFDISALRKSKKKGKVSKGMRQKTGGNIVSVYTYIFRHWSHCNPLVSICSSGDGEGTMSGAVYRALDGAVDGAVDAAVGDNRGDGGGLAVRCGVTFVLFSKAEIEMRSVVDCCTRADMAAVCCVMVEKIRARMSFE